MKYAQLFLINAFFPAAMPQSLTANDKRHDDLVAAFQDWATENHVSNAAIVLTDAKGFTSRSVDHEVGLAGRDNAFDLASHGKAITAICTAVLFEEGLSSPETTPRDVLGYSPEGITVAQLLTHISGLNTDMTQLMMVFWVSNQTRRWQFVTQTAYADACTPPALEPAGVTSARVSSLIGTTLPWDGWRMTRDDHPAFLRHWFGTEGLIGQRPQYWQHATVSGPVEDGMDMFQARVDGKTDFWHFGVWCTGNVLSTGRHATTWQGNISAVAACETCIDDRVTRALRRAMDEGARQ